jgi:hypothetical protein
LIQTFGASAANVNKLVAPSLAKKKERPIKIRFFQQQGQIKDPENEVLRTGRKKYICRLEDRNCPIGRHSTIY